MCSAAQMYSERKRFKGVSRSPWSLTWDSHVPIAAASTGVGAGPTSAGVLICSVSTYPLANLWPRSPVRLAVSAASQISEPDGSSTAQWLYHAHAHGALLPASVRNICTACNEAAVWHTGEGGLLGKLCNKEHRSKSPRCRSAAPSGR